MTNRATIAILPALPRDLASLHAIDEDATALYAEHAVAIELSPDHPFVQAELGRWLRSAELGRAFVAVEPSGEQVGFATLDWLDRQPYLDQLAVRRSAMRRGIGERLLERSAEWGRAEGGTALWLTTYAHLPFNRPYYERHGYQVVPETSCGPHVREHLEQQRRYLPASEQRIAMRLIL
jgi:GNAT superfamily N-acetyltransferase